MSTNTVTPPPIDPNDVQIDLSSGLQPKGPDLSAGFQPKSGDIDVSDVQIEPDSQPVQEGEQLATDTKNKIIVPKPDESFSDTVARAVKLGKARQAAGTEKAVIAKETATMPAKTAQTLGTAATVGVLGPATLALPGELRSSIGALTAGVKAVGAWAEAHPVHAYLVYQALKELIPGVGKAAGIIKHAPTGE